MDVIQAVLTEALSALEQAQDSEALEALRVNFLGKNGQLTELLKRTSTLSIEERPLWGQKVNQAKVQLQQDIQQRQQQFDAQALNAALKDDVLDITLPATGMNLGTLHPVTQSFARIIQCFERLGFDVAQGPEVEDDYHNFEALNIPAHHPARADHDTFYFDANNLLRTHTSGVQIRTMAEGKPPFRFISPGRVYRCDSDMTHTPMFHQVEGLWVDEHVHFGMLKSVLSLFIQDFFEKPVNLRLRASHFPFTEPSAEVDITCVNCGGSGCRVCKNTGWIEVLGCGMVHPNVLKSVGIDPERYRGFAFGMGVERFTMLRYGVSDIRLFYESDIRFLNQFK